jgi:hypothetical protein
LLRENPQKTKAERLLKTKDRIRGFFQNKAERLLINKIVTKNLWGTEKRTVRRRPFSARMASFTGLVADKPNRHPEGYILSSL